MYVGLPSLLWLFNVVSCIAESGVTFLLTCVCTIECNFYVGFGLMLSRDGGCSIVQQSTNR